MRLKLQLLSFLVFTFISLTTMADAMSNALIFKACKNASNMDPVYINYNFCTTSLQAAPDSPCASMRKLGMISIRLANFNATNTRCYIKELLKNKKLDTYVKLALNDCNELYSEAMNAVRLAAKNYGTKKYYDAKIQISSIMDDAQTCEQGFTERKGVKSPLTKRNSELFELCAITLSVMNMVQ